MAVTYDLNEMIDLQESAIDAYRAMHGNFTVADDAEAQDILDEIDAELDAAQEALDAAKAAMAEEPPNTALAKSKLQESMDHTKRALELLRELIGRE